MALSIAASALFDLGDKASWITTEDSGIRASGNPKRRALWMADATIGPRVGFARPISSYTITDSLRQIASSSPPWISLAK